MHLLLSHRDTIDRSLIAEAAKQTSIEATALSGYRVPTDFAGNQPLGLRIYAEPLFADVVASQLDLTLLEAPLDWLTRLPENLLGRQVQLTTLGQARCLHFPRFVKAIDDKRFAPQVYAHCNDIDLSLDDETVVLTCEPVHWEQEIRLFVKDGQLLTGSVYMDQGQPMQSNVQGNLLHRASAFVDVIFDQVGETLPPGIVLDIGQHDDSSFTVIEANAAWGSGLYACDPVLALPSVLAASCSAQEASLLDASWIRAGSQVDFQ